jgi:hydrogenase/urease accessory protein HupE
MKHVNLFVSVLFFISIPIIALAHPGHGDHTHDGFSIIHYFTEPEHALVTIGILVSIAVAFYHKYQVNRKKV